MKTYKIVTIAALALVAVALVTTSAYAYMGGRAATPYGTNTGVSGAYGTYQGGMMGGRGMMGGYAYSAPAQPTVPAQPGTPTTTTPPYQYYGGMGCGGMRAWTGTTAPSYTSPTTGTPIDIATAVATAQNYVASLNNANLAVAHVEEFTQNFYVQVKEKDTGVGAFELLINKYTGTISPEMGPNMMWNTKYGMMGSGMMGYYYTSTPTATMPVTVDQAKTDAQQFLNIYYAGTTVGDATTFYGYYTIEVLNAGSPSSMLSVNGYTGQVWYHTWHGTFIQEWTP